MSTQVTPDELNLTPTSGSNTGTAGGTWKYITFGGLKIAWGVTASLSMTSSAQTTATVVFPVTFSAAPVVTLGGVPAGTVYGQAHLNSTPSTTGMTLALDATTGTQT